MYPTLDKKAVSEWLLGQRAAAERIKAERTRFLLTLTPEMFEILGARSLLLVFHLLSVTFHVGTDNAQCRPKYL